MFNLSRFSTIGLVLSLSFSAPLYARGHGGEMMSGQLPDDMVQYDTNQDGRLSQTELQAARAAEFKQADTSADSSLDLAELQAQMDSRKAERLTNKFTNVDADSNGQISLEEFQSHSHNGNTIASTNLFALVDKDQSGGLSQEEFATLESEEGHLLRQFTDLDSDGDGKISESEYTAAMPGGHHGGPGGR